MNKFVLFVVAGTALFLASAAWADIPAPPVNQSIGMTDVLIANQTEADCRACHTSGVPNRHHLLYGTPLAAAPTGTNPDVVPYPDTDGDGLRDANYSCLSCHGQTFTIVRDCLVCHQTSPHHTTTDAQARHCSACHGSVVSDYDDGHYVPTYSPSLVTPKRSQGDGLPLNSVGNGAGACDYCHDADNADPLLATIRTNHDLHHGVKLGLSGKCIWCHDVAGSPVELTLRTSTANACENCHGPTALHNIQADSPAAGNVGSVVVGGEDMGYGHIGKDAGPGNSDCWGCHGFAFAAAPGSGPVIPTVYNSDKATITAGTATSVVLTGAAFSNALGTTVYEADVKLTGANGSSVTLTPDIIVDQGSLAVTIPGTTVPGNYSVQAAKADFTSNPTVVSIVPKVKITRATSRQRTVTITGGGFAGYAAGSATSVTGTTSKGKTVKGTVVSWTDGKIVANFGTVPAKVTVTAVFGTATSKVRR